MELWLHPNLLLGGYSMCVESPSQETLDEQNGRGEYPRKRFAHAGVGVGVPGRGVGVRVGVFVETGAHLYALPEENVHSDAGFAFSEQQVPFTVLH